METPSRQCPFCHAPLQTGAPFCGRCGFDLPAEDHGAKPRPEKCPFCSEPVEGDELACRQCGFDLDREWQPETTDQGGLEQEVAFDPKVITCRHCGHPNQDRRSFCAKCSAPVSSTIALMPGIEGVWFDGYIIRRLVGPLDTLPPYVRTTRRIIGITNMVGAAAIVIGAPFVIGNLWEGVALLLVIPMGALYGVLGYFMTFGPRPARPAADAAGPQDRVAPPPDNG